MVDLPADSDTEEEDMDEARATPSPMVSEDDGSKMETDEEAELLAYTGKGHDGAASSSDDDGFQHV